MALNDRFTQSVDGLAASSDFTITATGTDTGVVELTEIAGTGDCNVFLEVDEGQDGTFNVSIQIGSPSNATYETAGDWRIQAPEHWVGNDGTTNETRIRVNNVSGGAIDATAIGFEVGTQ
jgi:hypothetical protein